MQKWEYLYIYRDRAVDQNASKLSGWTYYVHTREAMTGKKWEGNLLMTLFCELGDQGWELVTSHPRSNDWGEYAGLTLGETFVFKRPVE